MNKLVVYTRLSFRMAWPVFVFGSAYLIIILNIPENFQALFLSFFFFNSLCTDRQTDARKHYSSYMSFLFSLSLDGKYL